jgi:hypothetical protein
MDRDRIAAVAALAVENGRIIAKRAISVVTGPAL